MQLYAISLLCLMLFPHISFQLHLEIHLRDTSGSSVIAKIICVPKGKSVHNEKDQQIWWKGSKMGSEERNRLRQDIPDGTFIPAIRVNSTTNYQCFLMSPKSNINRDNLRKRIHREIAASVPAEFGNCSPGYRLHQDRCYPCPPGTFTSGQETNCNLCPKDFYNNKEAADSCNPCPEAKKTLVDGADSENLCSYLDPSGRPVNTFSTKLIVIGVCATIFIVAAWILMGLYLYWWYQDRKIKKDDGGEKSSSEEHIYSEIEESSSVETAHPDDDGYEIPRKPDKDKTYLELLPDADGYEEPIKPSYDDHIYESIKGEENYNVLEQSKQPINKPQSEENKSFSTKPQTAGNDKSISRKISKQKQDDMKNLIDVNFDELYANAHAIPNPREHREYLPKTESYGFQPLLSPSEEGRLEVKKSDFNQLAKIILRTSKSENDAWVGIQAPNLEELGYDVEKLSKVIETITERTGSSKTSEELLESASRARVRQVRSFSEKISKMPQDKLLRNTLKERRVEGLRAEDFEFKSSVVKDGKREVIVPVISKSSRRVDLGPKAQKSTSLPHASISITVSDPSDVDADISVESETES